jgi:hypothetical protein
MARKKRSDSFKKIRNGICRIAASALQRWFALVKLERAKRIKLLIASSLLCKSQHMTLALGFSFWRMKNLNAGCQSRFAVGFRLEAIGQVSLCMSFKLTWDDLLIQKISESDVSTWLGYWPGRFTVRVAPVFMSKFGDWFLRLPDGGTDEFSVIEGTYSSVASKPEESSSLVNTQA